jgi:hypothetical protein
MMAIIRQGLQERLLKWSVDGQVQASGQFARIAKGRLSIGSSPPRDCTERNNVILAGRDNESHVIAI